MRMVKCSALLRVNIPLCSRLGKKPMIKPTGLMTRHKTFLFTSPSMAPPLPEPQSNHNGSVFMAHNKQRQAFFSYTCWKKSNPQQPERLCYLRYRIRSLHRGGGGTQNGQRLRSCARCSNERARREGESGCRPV